MGGLGVLATVTNVVRDGITNLNFPHDPTTTTTNPPYPSGDGSAAADAQTSTGFKRRSGPDDFGEAMLNTFGDSAHYFRQEGETLLEHESHVGWSVYGARFSTEIHTRGCHWFPRLLLEGVGTATNGIPLG
jgi:hypothetical protein